MTVQELIDILEEYPDDFNIKIDWDKDCVNVYNDYLTVVLITG